MSLEFRLEQARRDFRLTLSGIFDKKTVGIFGRSGAGKTSFFNLLCGLEKPENGLIALNGRVLTDTEKNLHVPAQKRRTGTVFQEKLLFPHLTVRKNLLFGTKYHKQSSVAYDDIIDLLALGNLLDSLPSEISGGEQQRTAIGRALLCGPELLLLDEPFSALDETLKLAILPYLHRIRDELDIPMLVISHMLSDIQYLTDNIYCIDNGECTGHGSLIDMIEANHEIAKQTRLANVFALSNPEKLESGLYRCKLDGTKDCWLKVPSAPSGERFFMTLYPDEISLSVKKVPYISIRNQIPGKIRKIITLNGSVYCTVDAGIPLFVKITRDAVENLGLKNGINVVCLFKTSSLHL
ncbi:MAG: molybdenum ABC transporter ATP-binding protein [Spirochaetales bacterium]|nr:molybdenum ABC transporter ATP-binding protein [Spirochaetales bacterium]